MTTMERIRPNPEHGRPVIALLTSRDGQVSINCARETGALWLFATGPYGGDRGHVVLGLSRADAVLAWLDAPDGLLLGGASSSWLSLRGKVLHLGGRAAARGGLKLTLDDDVRDEFLLCLREWASVARLLEVDG